MEKENRKKLASNWNGTIIEIQHLENYNEHEKARLIFLVDGGEKHRDEIEISAFGVCAAILKKMKAGQKVAVQFMPSSHYNANRDKWYNNNDLIRIEKINGVEL